MVEGARLESVYTETYRGFESLPHRHLKVQLSLITSKKAANCKGLRPFLCFYDLLKACKIQRF